MDSDNYRDKKRTFDHMITLYGRKTVQEILLDEGIAVHCLHLAESNRREGIISDIEALASARNIPVRRHARDALSRISKNRRQDQGVAIDLTAPNLSPFLDEETGRGEWLLLDRVQNPQNLGMILRTIAASPMTGVILPREGSASIDPLVWKASAGCLLRTELRLAPDTAAAVEHASTIGFEVIALSGQADTDIRSLEQPGPPRLWILGNESEGIAPAHLKKSHKVVSIPLENGVESLNVSIAAALVAFRGRL